jgi:hypothetical protein
MMEPAARGLLLDPLDPVTVSAVGDLVTDL